MMDAPERMWLTFRLRPDIPDCVYAEPFPDKDLVEYIRADALRDLLTHFSQADNVAVRWDIFRDMQALAGIDTQPPQEETISEWLSRPENSDLRSARKAFEQALIAEIDYANGFCGEPSFNAAAAYLRNYIRSSPDRPVKQ